MRGDGSLLWGYGRQTRGVVHSVLRLVKAGGRGDSLSIRRMRMDGEPGTGSNGPRDPWGDNTTKYYDNNNNLIRNNNITDSFMLSIDENKHPDFTRIYESSFYTRI
uniref:Uncharacterized protein n=1 Tax=Romanomermis culicivorax TaxID=13658 RepID=A0A915K4M5_ROMCU